MKGDPRPIGEIVAGLFEAIVARWRARIAAAERDTAIVAVEGIEVGERGEGVHAAIPCEKVRCSEASRLSYEPAIATALTSDAALALRTPARSSVEVGGRVFQR